MKIILFIVFAFFTFGSSALFTHLYQREDDMSLRYMLWKKGLHPRPDDILLGALIADEERNRIIGGKTKEEIKQLFPNVHEISINDYQRMYDRELKGRDILWIGESNVVIVFESGKSIGLTLMKG